MLRSHRTNGGARRATSLTAPASAARAPQAAMAALAASAWLLVAAAPAPALAQSGGEDVGAAAPGAQAAGSAMAARDSADLAPKGTVRVGVFTPLSWVIREGVELEAHPLLVFVAPSVTGRFAVGKVRGVRLLVEAGLGLPTTALRTGLPPGLQGNLTPACKVSTAEPERGDSCDLTGHVLVGRVGLAASVGDAHISTLRLDGAYGALLSGERARPLDSWAPLDLLLAPVFRTTRLHAMVRHDRALHRRLRGSGELHIYRVGGVEGDGDRSLWALTAHLGLDFALTDETRITAGALYTNHDGRATDVSVGADGFAHRERVRSHRLWPTLDVIWTF